VAPRAWKPRPHGDKLGLRPHPEADACLTPGSLDRSRRVRRSPGRRRALSARRLLEFPDGKAAAIGSRLPDAMAECERLLLPAASSGRGSRLFKRFLRLGLRPRRGWVKEAEVPDGGSACFVRGAPDRGLGPLDEGSFLPLQARGDRLVLPGSSMRGLEGAVLPPAPNRSRGARRTGGRLYRGRNLRGICGFWRSHQGV